MSKALSILFCVFALFRSLEAAPQGEKIEFFRPSVPGRVCHIKASVSSSCTYSVRPVSTAKAPARKEKSTASVSGTMKVLECSNKGNPVLFEFTIESISGYANGNVLDEKPLLGKTVTVKKKPDSVSFSLQGNDMAPIEKTLLQMLFQPDNGLCLKDIISTERPLMTGDSWEIGTPEKKNTLSVSGMAFLKGRESFSSIDCWKIEYSISVSDKKNGLDSSALTEILLPVEKEKGGPVKISSKQRRKIEKELPSENPITAGTLLSIDESVDFNAEITTLP
ncbi:MAG: hypothetical protein A2020_03495 [Lentisphaerae bacterium GWF2_45_14]|nr:MAG: hypothetical protein A2020_03495 [Lentisphaerae bacterium GWF2_45_14]